jgi:hypothetical protein
MKPRRPTRSRRHIIRSAWNDEIHAARTARRAGDREVEWLHLERAHIASQPIAHLHVATHGLMLIHGVRRRDHREVRGQLFRVVVAAPGSWTRRYPLGNTGGANVDPYTPMPLPADLQDLLGHHTSNNGENS